MNECTHHWTVTSECPMCLRGEVNALRHMIRDLCIGHVDNCNCIYCQAVFRTEPGVEEKKA